MAIPITDEELLSYSMLPIHEKTLNSSGTLYIHNGYVYKMFFNDFSKRILYLLSLPKHPHVLLPEEEIKPEWLSDFKSGYTIEYKEKAKTFFETFGDHLSFEEKSKYIKQIFSGLEHLHQFIILGDIHGDNFLISEQNAFLCDLDYYRKLEEKGKPFKCKYSISKQEKRRQTTYTDVIKTYIESYSFLFEEDLSFYIKVIGYKKLCEILLTAPMPKEMLEFLNLSLIMLKEKRLLENMYEPNRFITPNILDSKKELKLVLDKL